MKNYKRIIDFLFPASRELKKPRITLNHKASEDYQDIYTGHSALISVTYIFDKDLAIVSSVNRAGRDLPLMKILFDGTPQIKQQPSELERAMLDRLNGDVIDTLRTYGRKGGHCCICGIILDDPRSLAVGYGPVCAVKWALPWTKQEVAEFERTHDVKWNVADELEEIGGDEDAY